MSPRVAPRKQRNAFAPFAPPPDRPPPSEIQTLTDAMHDRNLSPGGYHPSSRHSFFRDLLAVTEATRRERTPLTDEERRERRALVESPDLLSRDVGAAEARLKAWGDVEREWRDLSSTTAPDALRPSAPGFIAETFGRAARAQATLAAALGLRPLEDEMVDTTGGQAVVSVPRLATGAAVAVQASQNAAVQETDPTTAKAESPVTTIAGLVDMSRQLFDLSRPGFDTVLAEDLGRAHGASLDAELVQGTGTAGRTLGLNSVTGVLSLSFTGTTAAALVTRIWEAYSQLAGPTGFGAVDRERFLLVMHPRRYSWLAAGVQPGGPFLPGELVLTAGTPTNVSTNQDVVHLVDRDAVHAYGRPPTFKVYEEIGSGTLTVRIATHQSAAAMFNRTPLAVARVGGTGLATPTFT